MIERDNNTVGGEVVMGFFCMLVCVVLTKAVASVKIMSASLM